MDSPCALAAVLLALVVLNNKESCKWFLIISCAYVAIEYWIISLPLLLLTGLIWGSWRLFSSGRAEEMFETVTVWGGLILAVVVFAKLFPRAFDAIVGVIAVTFYALAFVAALWIVFADPLKEQRLGKH